MNAILKLRQNGRVTFPARLLAEAGIVEGDWLEVTFRRGKLIFTPKLRQAPQKRLAIKAHAF